MALTLTFNQAGLPAGETDRARTDIVADGTPVTITVGGIPDGSLVEVTLLDEPPGSNPHITSSSPASWSLTFDAGCWGPFRIRATATIGQDVVSAVTRRISIRSPELGIHYPALAERTDPNATLVPTVPSVQLTEMNEGSTNRPVVTFHRQLLEAVESIAATGGGGGGGGPATELDTTGAPVNVGASAPPTPGQVLTAIDAEHSIWRAPGLHYDPAILSWTTSAGQATIEPNTWGIVRSYPAEFPGPVIVYIVSSLEAPPVDSRIGLYVAPTMDLPVEVHLIGASQIMGLDGVLAPTATLRPGAFYQWLLYHEDSTAVWGLVGDTAHVAKALAAAGGSAINVANASPPNPGDVLTADDAGNAVWAPPPLSEGDNTVDVLATGVDNLLTCVLCQAGESLDVGSATVVDEMPVAATIVLLTAQDDPTENGLWDVSHTGEWNRSATQPEIGQFVFVGDGALYNGTTWVLTDTDVYRRLNEPMALNAGDRMIKVGNTFSALAPTFADVADALAAADAPISVNGQPITDVADPVSPQDAANMASVIAAIAAAAGVAGAGLTKTGNTFNVIANADGSIVANADDIQVGVISDAQHGTRGGGTTHATASSSASGFMAAADKVKLDALASTYRAPVRLVSVFNITLSGLASVDGVTPAAGDRVLVTGQTTQSQNGIYEAASGAWTRASDADTSAKVLPGLCVYVTEGVAYADSLWSLTTNGTITLGTTALQWDGAGAGSAPGAISWGGSANSGGRAKWAREDHSHNVTLPDISINNFRITNQTGGSMPNDDNAGGFVYLRQHTGNRIALFTGVFWQPVTLITGPSVSVSGQTTGIPCDVFAVYVNSTSATLELAAWANATTRATALAQQDGVWVKSGAPTRRYVGTILPNGAGTYAHLAAGSGSTKAVCGIWNQDNRIKSSFTWTPTFNTWSPAAADTWEPLGGGSGPHVDSVLGQSVDGISALAVSAFSSTPTAAAALGIGIDSTTAPTGFRHSATAVSASVAGLTCHANQRPAAGRRTINALAYANTTAALFYGASGAMQGGLSVDIWH